MLTRTAGDFVFTIDSDDEGVDIPNLELESDDEDQLDTKRKSKKFSDISPNFLFSAEGAETEFASDGWDYEIEEGIKSKKDIDLDSILRSKGGLKKSEQKKKVTRSSDSVSSLNKENSVDAGNSNDENSEVESDESKSEDDNEVEKSNVKSTEDNDSASETEDIPQDTPEDIANFFDQTKQSSGQLHKDFLSLQLSRPILKGLSSLGYLHPTPIQSEAIPIALLGKDIVAGAITGSGKTAAYMIPILERLLYKPAGASSTRVIIMTPTRELAVQVYDVGTKIAKFISSLSFGLAVGGLNLRQQEQQLKSRPDIVVATPGRLIDHVRNSPSFSIDSLEVMVIDEADRILEEGFQAELTEILSLVPKQKRQTLLFSATMNTRIQDLIQLSLDKPVRIMIDPPKSASSNLVQEFVRLRSRDNMKPALLFQILNEIDSEQQRRVVVFVGTKEASHKLRIILGLLGLKVSELHGSLTQEQRLRNVSDLKALRTPVLICTDLAARGLDIPKIEVVINYDMPKTYEIYLHRVGRTARAGREGMSITFVGESSHDRSVVKQAFKSLSQEKSKHGKARSRPVDWKQVDELHKQAESKQDLIQEVINEEKQAKQLLQAEMELEKASNLIKHEKEIHSRPKRTWFESQADKNSNNNALSQLSKGKKVNSKKRKSLEAKKMDAKPRKTQKQDNKKKSKSKKKN